MKAFVITIPGHEVSEQAAANCIESSKKVGNDFDIEVFDAVVPKQVNKLLKDFKIRWNYPWEGEVFDFKTGLKKKAYPTVNREARIACALSHYTLWHKCANQSISVPGTSLQVGIPEPFLILEHDARFVSKLDYDYIENSNYEIVGINNPLFATRLANFFKKKVEEGKREIVPAPNIDTYEVPQGLAGNSAYVIKPKGADNMLKLVNDHGLWPNDALMCRQLVSKLGVTKKFYTEVQGTPSTTTG